MPQRLRRWTFSVQEIICLTGNTRRNLLPDRSAMDVGKQATEASPDGLHLGFLRHRSASERVAARPFRHHDLRDRNGRRGAHDRRGLRHGDAESLPHPDFATLRLRTRVPLHPPPHSDRVVLLRAAGGHRGQSSGLARRRPRAYALHGRLLGRDLSSRNHVNRQGSVAGRARAWNAPGPDDATHHPAAGDTPNAAALRQSVRAAAQEHLAAFGRGGAGPYVHGYPPCL